MASPVSHYVHRDAPLKSFGPYRATKMWNDLIKCFRSNVSVSRRWRYMKVYDDCFIASDAVNLMHTILLEMPKFADKASRLQATLLLEKFHKAGVFEDVRGLKYDGEPFEDNGRLFKLTVSQMTTPKNTARPALSSKTNVMQAVTQENSLQKETHSVPLEKLDNTASTEASAVNHKAYFFSKFLRQVERAEAKVKRSKSEIPESLLKTTIDVKQCTETKVQAEAPDTVHTQQETVGENDEPCKLTVEEDEVTWKSMVLSRLRAVLGVSSLGEVVDECKVNARHLIHNMTSVNKNGIVTNIDKSDQLPAWILQAMRCLAYWPDYKDVPHYQGFETDVLKLVKDHFHDMNEPLITYDMYQVFKNITACLDEDKTPTAHSRLRTTEPRQATFKSLDNIISGSSVKSVPVLHEQQSILIINDTDRLDSGFIAAEDDLVSRQWTRRENRSSLHALQAGLESTHTSQSRYVTSFGVDSNEPTTIEVSGRRSKRVLKTSAVKDVTNEVPLNNGHHRKNSWLCGDVSGNYTDCFEVSSMSGTGSNHATTGSTCYYNLAFDSECSDRTDSASAAFSGVFDLDGCSVSSRERFNRSARSRGLTGSSLGSQVSEGVWEGGVGLECTQAEHYWDSQTYKLVVEDLEDNLGQLPAIGEQPTDRVASLPMFVIHGCVNCQQMKASRPACAPATVPNKSTDSLSHSAPRPPKRTDSLQDEPAGDKCRCGSTSPPGLELSDLTVPAGFTASRKPSVKAVSDLAESYRQAVSRGSVTEDVSRSSRKHRPSQSTGRGSGSSKRPDDTSSCRIGISKPTDSYRLVQNGSTPAGRGGLRKRPAPRPEANETQRAVSSPDLLIELDAQVNGPRVLQALQICTLLIPPPNRRMLHLLLRLMYKMTNNPKLSAPEPYVSVRDLVLDEFTRCIIRSADESVHDDSFCKPIVEYMMDNYNELMMVPSQLKNEVEKQITKLQRLKEYENQRYVGSQGALEQLLDGIVSDSHLSDKNKRRKLRQFQSSYPEIYSRRFAANAENIPLPQKPKMKQPLLSNPLHKLKLLRL